MNTINNTSTCEIKPSIWCELSIENYKNLFPLLQENDLCPECMKYEVKCVFFKHRKKIKYFYAYNYNYIMNMNMNKQYFNIDFINTIRLYENEI